MTNLSSAEYWANMADMAEYMGADVEADTYRRLAGLHRLEEDIARTNQEANRAIAEIGHQSVQQAVMYIRTATEPPVYMAAPGTEHRAGQWTEAGWIDEEWEWSDEQHTHYGHDLAHRIRNTNHTIDVTFASPDGARLMALLMGGPRTPHQDYPPAAPPYAGLRQAIARHYAQYPHPAYKAGGYIPTPTQQYPRQVGKAGRPPA